MMSNVLIEPAATLVLVKDSSQGPRVLMQKRNPNAAFVGGAWVFPGGKIDPEDSHEEWPRLIQGLDEDRAINKLDLGNATTPYNVDQISPHEANLKPQVKALAYWIAVMREAFEEAGILLTLQSVTTQQREQWRELLLDKKMDWLSLVTTNQLTLAMDHIHYLSRWITPPGNPRRYDTRFFIAKAPQDQEPSHENYEAIETCWITPENALSAYEKGEMKLISPTIITLKAMCGYSNATTLLNQALTHFNPEGDHHVSI